MTNLRVLDEEKTDSEVKALELKARVDGLQVIDRASYEVANAINADAYRLRKAFHEWFDPIDEASKKQRQAAIAQGKKIDEPFEYVIKTTGSKAAAWIRSEEEKAREEQRKAEAIARKAAEDAQIRAAEALQAEGLTNAAESILEAPAVSIAVPSIMPKKADGVSYIDRYSVEVIDLMELVKAVAEGKAPKDSVCAAESWLNQWARLTKGGEAIPGVKVVKTTTQTRRI